jgi:hypothetical protein
LKNIKVRLAESVDCEEQTKKYDFEIGAAVVQLKKADLM